MPDPSRADHSLAAGRRHLQLVMGGALRQLGEEHQQVGWGRPLRAPEKETPWADRMPSSFVINSK